MLTNVQYELVVIAHTRGHTVSCVTTNIPLPM
jgi:hypothetical protein